MMNNADFYDMARPIATESARLERALDNADIVLSVLYDGLSEDSEGATLDTLRNLAAMRAALDHLREINDDLADVVTTWQDIAQNAKEVQPEH